MRLVCFTFAGGSGSFFNGIESYLRTDIELVKLEYAGHMERRHEPFYRDFDEFGADMYNQIRLQDLHKEPYALFGYSMGAIAATEVTKVILAKGELPLPVHVFLASHAPCPIQNKAEIDRNATDEAVKQWTIRFGGLHEKLINSRTFWRIYLPIYRADYKLITGYDFRRLDWMTDIPATGLFSPADISYTDMEKWHRVFVGECDILEYDGGHFFLRDHEREVADVIKRRLSQYAI